VDRDQIALASLYPTYDIFAKFQFDFRVSHMAPPNDHLCEIEHGWRYALLSILDRGRTDLEARLGPQVLGNCIPEKVIVGLFLGGLLLVPNKHTNRFIRGDSWHEAQSE
jgi:hypothetical protein